MVTHVGVDGCRAGWVAVFEEGGQLAYSLFAQFEDIVVAFPVAEILIDIPIGLPWTGCRVRPCDTLARKHLGAIRASSVFPAPTRAACNAADVGEARRQNLAEVGKSLSSQAWGICPKVAEVDATLLSDRTLRLRPRVREMHPEVCFWSLNERVPMSHSKGTKAGELERLSVILRHEPRSRHLLDAVLREQRRRDVKTDDVLDALVGFVTVSAPLAALRKLRGFPERDQEGLPMEMLYFEP